MIMSGELFFSFSSLDSSFSFLGLIFVTGYTLSCIASLPPLAYFIVISFRLDD